VSNTATIAVSGATGATRHVLTSIVGDGVTGTPKTGSASSPEGGATPYSYVAASGYSAGVEVDGEPSPLSGTITADGDHWVWAFGQPLQGTDFPGYITAPNDPFVIPYPAFYQNRPASQTVRVADPYCALQSPIIAYPRSFLGSFPLPSITGAPLPASIQRGVQLKDYWNAPGFGIVQGNQVCKPKPSDMHDAFTASVVRIKQLGADHIGVVDTPVIVDSHGNRVVAAVSGQTPFVDPAGSGLGISDDDLAFIASTVSAAGLDLWIDIQVCCFGGDPPDAQWLSEFLDAYTQYIVHEAQRAQKYGAKSIMLNWDAWFFDTTPFGDLFPSKMLAALAQVRAVFKGTVRFSDAALHIPDPGSGQFAALYKGVDMIQTGNSQFLLSPDEDQNLSFAFVKGKYKRMLAETADRFAAFPTQPLQMLVLIQSHRHFLNTGWIEDSFCANGCVQNTLETDFSVQALAYEALMEATVESGLKIASIDPVGYWYVDVILPKDTFPNIAQSVRNKPAEVILQRWFRR
jgi:hypothetical protein